MEKSYQTGDLGFSSSDPSSQSSLCNSTDEVDWRERCQVLEVSLQKFKQKAARIRELLADKMQDMECRVQEANQRASLAEDKCNLLERKLVRADIVAGMPLEGGGDAGKQLQRWENECQDKDIQITSLQCQLEEQRQLRLQEARLVEEKSAKIREWVTGKVQDMEMRNVHLTVENKNLKEQVDSLNFRLQCLSIADHRPQLETRELTPHHHHQTTYESSAISSPPMPQASQSTSFHAGAHRYHEFEDLVERRPTDDDDDVVGPTTATTFFGSDYQEIDESRESTYRPKVMPQVKIERKIFAAAKLPQSLSIISSSTGSRELLNSEATDDRRSSRSSSSDLPANDVPTPVTLTPKEPPSPLTPFLPNVPPNSPLPLGAFDAARTSQIVSAVATMPRRRKGDRDDDRFFPQTSKPEKNGGEYGPLTIDRKLKKSLDPARLRPKPPTPPMRRLPSWESRIYAIAASGFQVTNDSSTLPPEVPSNFSSKEMNSQICESLAVPVYAMLKGRAAQIRSLPFTGESSSDSSDDDVGGEEELNWSKLEKTATSDSIAKESRRENGGLSKPLETGRSGGRKRTTPGGDTSSQSVASDTSSDYALPPDDGLSVKTDSSDTCEPELKLIKYTTDAFKKGSHEKSGFLSKLGGKVKCWQQRWFVLKNGELLYYKSPNDMSYKSRGHISLDANTRVQRMNTSQTFEIIASKRTYYLTADSADEADHWIRVLLNVLHKHATDLTLQQGCAKETICGWLIKTKNGRRRRCWCVLVGKIFIYYRSPVYRTPLGQITLHDARIEEIDRSCETDSDSDMASHAADYTLAIWPPTDGPTYLLIPVKQKKDSWLYHLTVACGGGLGRVGTDYEQLIAKLMAVEGDVNATFWKDPVLLYAKEPLVRSLTTLPSEELQTKALELFRQCHSFTHIVIETSQLDVHVSLVQTILGVCLQFTELQTELFCHLVRQTSRHPPQQKTGGMQNFLLCGSHSWFQCDSSPTSPTNSVVMDLSDSKLNPAHHVLVQGWQLLTMAISLFVPKQSVLWFLRIHLQRNADSRAEPGKYAIFCQCALERTLQNSSRERRPSRLEVLSILLRNPYHHSQPISIPVHFVNGSYQVVSFDGSTTVQEFLFSLNKALNMRDCALSGFGLFTDDPNCTEVEHCLKTHFKLCDVISKWEQSAAAPDNGRVDVTRTVKITYKNRLYFKSMVRMETEKERLLLAYQANEEIIAGRFPASRDLAIELTALMAQIEYGDMKAMSDMIPPASVKLSSEFQKSSSSSPQHSSYLLILTQALERFYPKRYRSSSAADSDVSLEQSLMEKWMTLKSKSVQDCVRVYLAVTRKWNYFGAKLMSAKMKTSQDRSLDDVWLAINDDGISILERDSLKSIRFYGYGSIVTFGGCRDDFMLVVDDKNNKSTRQQEQNKMRSQRLIFVMTKPKVLETTLLVASYVNSRSQQMVAGLTTFPLDHVLPKNLNILQTANDAQK